MADDTAARLARVEAAISKHRIWRLQATWCGDTALVKFHDGEVDRLLGLWQRVRRGQPYTLTEFEVRPAVVGTVTEL